MGLANLLDISDRQGFSIDWEITPAYSFTMFESWGGKDGERIRNNDEKFYYFYVDAWASPAALYLMERGVKHARILARIGAPQDLIDECVAAGGRSASLDRSYAITPAIREWLIRTVVNETDAALVSPVLAEAATAELIDTGLPTVAGLPDGLNPARLRNEPAYFSSDQVVKLVRFNGYFDKKRNPAASFTNYLVDNNDQRTVTDQRTALMWGRQGCDLANLGRVRKYIDDLNRREFGGYDNWRLPTIDEALSLMEPVANEAGLHLHPCFSRQQPFIFTADQRRPGGYWFVDYKQGSVFWASGTIPGGFGRACRSA
ncbi:MAG: DUF1566 domain-containing protein [Desulfobulbales bacterium]|nr:DUF1566 domain-containing protein [Desulfobulbales bacterium]